MSDLGQTASEEAILLERGYKLSKKIGEGSYAKVYQADYKSQFRSVKDCTLACKIIDTSKAPKDFVRKFLPRELDILVKLNHPHVVHIHSIFQRRTKYFIFMRFAENGDLLDYILKNGAVSENQARIWLRQLALGLQYLHEMEIAHRDMKCENVLLTTNYNVKLADFGFSRYMIDNRGKRVLSDTYCGSLSYAAPEVLRGAPYNPKCSDIWSLGVILYIILNKAMPFDETNIKILYEQQLARKWKFRRKVDETISENAKTTVSNLLEPDTKKRWQVDQILYCDWIAMDPRLLILTPAEQSALNNAIEERKRNEEKFSKKKSSKIEKKSEKQHDNIIDDPEHIHILKGATKARVSSLLPTASLLKNLGT
ncbi:PREDICTED: testis-specific serine/threonine-protein kinase 3-like [Polistes dominula]|uniref:Testis-specific serine/threonine-protein kinase 3-like n=1 Tax=Polistes dominula TaxID=743375 RepID=A0ABM1J875_POLDO|nr:PREDICTED: testis-specific serine/threonine-protein kinase 3-like [Polistes dominula]